MAAASLYPSAAQASAALRLQPVHAPLLAGQEVVTIPLLESDAEQDVSDLFRLEQSGLQIWRKCAVEYWKRSLYRHALHVLQEGTKQDVEEFFAEEKYKSDRVAMLNTLAAIYTHDALKAGEQANNQKAVDDAAGRATQFWNRSMALDPECALTWVGRGLLQFVKNKYDDGDTFFKNAIAYAQDQKRDAVAAVLGRAIILYHKAQSMVVNANGTLTPAATQQYKEVLQMMKRAFDLNPDLPAAYRLGVAMCHFKLKDFDTARKAFERVLELDPDNLEALVGLATLELNGSAADRVERAMAYISRAHAINPSNPVVQTHLANHLFFVGAYGAVKKLANAVIASTVSKELKAEANFQVARCLHAEKKWREAAKHYQLASVAAPNHTLINYNYAQCLFELKEWKQATTLMERVYAEHKTDFNVLVLLGNLYAQVGDEEKARRLLKQASEASPDDVDLLLELFNVSQRADPTTAFNAMLRVTKLLPSVHGKPVPPEMWNNLAVVAMALGKYRNAMAALKNALRAVEQIEAKLPGASPAAVAAAAAAPASSPIVDSGSQSMSDDVPASASASSASGNGKDERTAAAGGSGLGAGLSGPIAAVVVKPRTITIHYNIAQLHERQSDTASAAALYRAILVANPKYTDARLRLGVLELRRGNTSGAIGLFTDAIKADPTNANAYSYLGLAHLEESDKKLAMKQFNHILKHLDKNDVYSKLMLGQIHTLMSADKSKQKNQLRLLDKAGKYYRSVLAKDARNVYAANGLGVVLTGRNRWNDARTVFTDVKDLAPELADVWLNLGHVFMSQGMHTNAIKLYEQIQKKFVGASNASSASASAAGASSEEVVNVLLYLANAYFQAQQMPQCKKALLRAIHLAPDDLMLWYNLALAQEDSAIQVLQTSMTNRTFAEVENAVNELRSAAAIFTRLEKAPNAKDMGIEPEKAKVHAQFSSQSLEAALPHLEHARMRERDNERMRLESQRARDEIERKAREAKDAQDRADAERKAALEEQARKVKTKLETDLLKWQDEKDKEMAENATAAGDGADAIAAAAAAGAEDGKKKSKKKRKKAAGADSDSDEMEGAGAGDGKRKKKSKKDKDSSAADTDAADADADADTTAAGDTKREDDAIDAAAAAAPADAAADAPAAAAAADATADGAAPTKRRLKRVDDGDGDGDGDVDASASAPATGDAAPAPAAAAAAEASMEELFGSDSPAHDAVVAPTGAASAAADPVALPAAAAAAPEGAAAAAADADADDAIGSTAPRRKRIVADDMETTE